MKQYVYSYHTVICNFSDWGPFNGNVWETQNYREIIDKKAKEGWRYVGYIPTHESSHGATCIIDLIFEKDVEETE